MKRLAFKMKLKPGFQKLYEERHKAIWPELMGLLKASGISEYSIFLDAETDTLFAFQKASNAESSQDLADHPVVQKWWNYMADIMEVHTDNAPISTPLKEVFFMK